MSSDDEKPKMRVSDWSNPTSSAESSPVEPVASPAPRANPTTPKAAENTAGEGMDLPVDPFRLLGGLWQRRGGLIIGALLGAVLLTAFGFWRTETRYQVSAQLIKREVPNSFRAGEIGEAFKPRTLSSATLIGLAGSTNVLRRVADRSEPAVSLSLLRRSAEVAEQRGTDYLFLTLSGYISPDATVELANIWSEEVVDYTREMQSRESREIRQYLQQELDANQAELERVANGLLEYTRREGLVNIDKQIDAELRAIGDLDLRYETTRLEIDSIQVKLRGLESELTRQSPLVEELKTAQANLAEIRNRYTDTNPIAVDAVDRVAVIQAQLDRDQASPSEDLSTYAGTFLGNTLYLQILDFRSQREALLGSLKELKILRDNARLKLQALPAKELGIAQLSRNRASLEGTRDLLLSRLREAELFEERAPGYYQIFSPATLDAVITRAKPLKVAVYGLLGLVAGGGFVFVAALGLELLDSRLVTAAEAAKAWGAPLLAKLGTTPTEDSAAAEDSRHQLWSRWLGNSSTHQMCRVIWSPKSDPLEGILWQSLITEAERLLPQLLIIDLGDGPEHVPELSHLPEVSLESAERRADTLQRVVVPGSSLSIEQANQLARRIRQIAATGRPIWMRLVGPVREPLSTLGQIGDSGLIAVPSARESIPFWREQAARYRATVGEIGGVVMLGEIPWHKR